MRLNSLALRLAQTSNRNLCSTNKDLFPRTNYEFHNGYIPRAGMRAMSVGVCGLSAAADVADGAHALFGSFSRSEKKNKSFYSTYSNKLFR